VKQKGRRNRFQSRMCLQGIARSRSLRAQHTCSRCTICGPISARIKVYEQSTYVSGIVLKTNTTSWKNQHANSLVHPGLSCASSEIT
jgi:hypothetical protein